MRTIERDIVGAFVFSNDAKTLLGLHAAGGAYAGLWVVLGGGVNEGETKEEALRREFLEEAELDLQSYDAKLFDESGLEIREKTLRETGEHVLVNMRFYDFEVHIDKSADEVTFRANEEFDDLRWINVSELPSLSVAPITYEGYRKLGYVHD